MKAITILVLVSTGFLFEGAIVEIEPAKELNRESEIDVARNGFVSAFNSRDLDALRRFMAPTADLVMPDGSVYRGQREIMQVFEGLAEAGLEIELNSESQRFLTSDVAIDDGTFAFSSAPEGIPTEGRYTVILVKQGQDWVVVSIRDSVPVPAAKTVEKEVR